IVFAAVPPPATSLSTWPALRSNPMTCWPALMRLSAIGSPILPRPMKPIAISVLPGDPIWLVLFGTFARRQHGQADIERDGDELPQDDYDRSAVDLREEQCDRRHRDSGRQPHHAAPGGCKPQPYGGDEIDHGEED